jgi:hypothetical protein
MLIGNSNQYDFHWMPKVSQVFIILMINLVMVQSFIINPLFAQFLQSKILFIVGLAYWVVPYMN